APKDLVRRWRFLVNDYLRGRAVLKRALVLVDSRHGLKDVDRDVMKMLDDAALSYHLVLTKADKVKPTELAKVLQATADEARKRPILWDGECVVWDSLAIIEFLADRAGRARYWPEDEGARGMARSMAAEMHSGFANLRRELPMNVRKSFPPKKLDDAVREEINRVLQLWAQARARFGGTGDFLFGNWCAADMMYAPVVTRFITYGVAVPNFAGVYMK